MFRESLNKGFKIFQESRPIFLVWLLFGVFSGLFTLMVGSSLTDYKDIVGLPFYAKILFGAFVVGYYYLHAGTLVYVRKKILQEHPSLMDFFVVKLKYVFSIPFISIIYFFLFLFITLCLVLSEGLIIPFTGFSPQSLNLTNKLAIIGIVVEIGVVNIWLALLLMYGPTVLVAENSKIFSAIKKSINWAQSFSNNIWIWSLNSIISNYRLGNCSSKLLYNKYTSSICFGDRAWTGLCFF